MCLIKRNALKNIRLMFLPFYGKKLLKLVFQCKVVVVFFSFLAYFAVHTINSEVLLRRARKRMTSCSALLNNQHSLSHRAYCGTEITA